jgi:peptidoglycan/xylan/chitin deacetylase (PgdA/CDA1 family)
MLTIVMYHYVRDLARTRFPRIKGLLTEKFDGQLDYIARHYAICSLAQVIATMRGEEELPPNACALTFDDGLADHYQTVFPRLIKRGFSGAFFPPGRPVEERCVLDVHKIQFILAGTTDYHELLAELLKRIEDYRARFAIPSTDELQKQFMQPGRFDPAEVSFIKRMLQWVLPREVRSEITDKLFAKYVTVDEAGFADQLYMQLPHLREMASGGMEIGGHGYNHDWLGNLSRENQSKEIQRTVRFLGNIFGQAPSHWMMCYPFGSYNSESTQLVSEMGCTLALTTKVGLANLSRPLELERLDTNDLPFRGDSNVCQWTEAVL